MSLRDQSTLRVALHTSGAHALDPETRLNTITALLERGYAITCASSESAEANGASENNMLVLGRFQDDQGTPTATEHIDVAGHDLPHLMDVVEARREDAGAAKHGEWKPWFPVIDYDRCTNCMQCLSFCLFGVYGVDSEQRIQVQNNDNCKTNCPACSRVCPEAAIMFPKYKAGPINGDVVSDADLQREKMKVDISSLLGGDVYQLLRDRSARAKSRFSKERDSDKALKERQKCLVALQQSGDIPPEVLLSLPSPDEIQRRAQEAAAKAQAALQAQGEKS